MQQFDVEISQEQKKEYFDLMERIRKRKGPIFRIEADEISMDEGSEMKIDDDQPNKHYQNDMMPSYAS